MIEEMIDQKTETLVEQWIDPKAHPEDWNLKELNAGDFLAVRFPRQYRA